MTFIAVNSYTDSSLRLIAYSEPNELTSIKSEWMNDGKSAVEA